MKKPVVQVFTSWRMAVTLLLGFVSGIPLALTFATLQAWLVSEKVDLTVVGVFSLVGIPYTLKFLWSPLMDRYVPPFLGRRRGWLVVWQLMLFLSISAMAFSDPANHLGVLAVFALLVAFSSASYDIVNDAYRIDLLTKDEYGAASSVYVVGYRLAMIVSGAGALILSDHLSWKAVYLIMASTMLVGVLITLLAPEPKILKAAPTSMQDAVVLPFLDFFKRRGAFEVLVFLVIYKLDTNLTVAMTTPFMLSLGFTRTDIGAVTKGFGTVAILAGGVLGGALMVRWGLKRSLWIFGVSQALAGFTYMALAHLGHNYPFMVAAITVENLFSGMGIAALGAFMMSLCDKRFSATQYALISSFMALSRYVANAPSGWLAKTVGWEHYFFICVVVGVPGLLLLSRYQKWNMPDATPDS